MNLNQKSHNQNGRPISSTNMTDLHIYVVPLDLWEEQQNMSLNEIINETISAGFIRVEPDQPLSDLRFKINDQLGFDFIPNDFMFCKIVGRSLSQVREKQERILKAKHFLPPNSYSPDLFVVDSVIAQRSQMTSYSNKSYNYTNSAVKQIEPESPEVTERVHYPDENQKENKNIKEEHESNLIKKKLKEKEIEKEENLKFETEKKIKEKEKEFNNKMGSVRPTNDPEMEIRRNEIENLQKEILKRYEELTSLENEHQKKIDEWEAEQSRRSKEEEERRRLFEEMEKERRRQEQEIIAKQKEELKKLEQLLKDKYNEIRVTEEKVEFERKKRDDIRNQKELEIKQLKEEAQENLQSDPEFHEKIHQLQDELLDIENKQKELEEIAREEKEQAELELQKAQIEFEHLQSKWQEEKNTRDADNSKKLLEEQRLRDIFEQKQLEHERRMEEERNKMAEERLRFDKEQMIWDEERMRYEEEEKRRLEEIVDGRQDAFNNMPVIPKFKLTDPDLILEGASESEQKSHLQKILKAIKEDREKEEKLRDSLIRNIRNLQTNTENRRNILRDMWKKKYADEKKKTAPLEDQMSRYKEELENIHKRLLNSMTGGVKEQRTVFKHPGVLAPSQKANMLLEAFRIQNDIEDMKQIIGFNQIRLSAEKKLRDQTEIESRSLKIDVLQRKIHLSRTRSDRLAIMPSINPLDFIYSPHHQPNTNRSQLNGDALNI